MSLVVIMGPPGAGKGQQSNYLKQMGYKHVAVGDLLRQVASDEGHSDHAVLKKQLGSGQLVSDTLVISIIKNHLQELPKDQKILLDGFPRTRPQAEAMVAMGIVPSCLIVLVVDDAVVKKRIAGRWIDPPSGRVYNMYFSPPQKVGFDDESGRALVQRNDDKPDVIGLRLDTYYSETHPVIDFFAHYGERHEMVIVYINGMDTIENVKNTIEQVLE